jgi:hypothetical protein
MQRIRVLIQKPFSVKKWHRNKEGEKFSNQPACVLNVPNCISGVPQKYVPVITIKGRYLSKSGSNPSGLS